MNLLVNSSVILFLLVDSKYENGFGTVFYNSCFLRHFAAFFCYATSVKVKGKSKVYPVP